MARGCLILALVVIIFFISASALSAEYVVIIAKNVNIRTGPGMANFIIGRAEKGDLYKYAGESGDWHKLKMFSGEIRYIGKSVGARLTESRLLPGHGMAAPSSEERRRLVYRDIQSAKERARREADQIIPARIDIERYNNFHSIREDGNILDIMHIYGIQPALYDDIMEEGEKKDW